MIPGSKYYFYFMRKAHVNWTNYDDHFAIYTNNESFCYTAEPNIILYVNNILIKEQMLML